MNQKMGVLSGFILMIAVATCASADDNEKVLFEEAFASKLGEGWSWVREEPKAWKVEQGSLSIRALPGYLYKKTNNCKNLLLRKPPATTKGLIVEVFVENQPALQYEHAGIAWYYDDDHYVGLWKEKVRNQEVLMVGETDGIPRFAEAEVQGEGVWLRLAITDKTATSFYRLTDKDEWEQVGQMDLPIQGAPKIALSAGGGTKAEDRWARFSRFRILEGMK